MITKSQRRRLEKLIEEYAESREHFYYAEDQYYGDAVREAKKFLEESEAALKKYLDKLAEEQ